MANSEISSEEKFLPTYNLDLDIRVENIKKKRKKDGEKKGGGNKKKRYKYKNCPGGG